MPARKGLLKSKLQEEEDRAKLAFPVKKECTGGHSLFEGLC